MTDLKYLSLEGNVIESIPDEAFQNLHHLSTLNLAYNHIETLNFAAFDSVGTLSHLLIGKAMEIQRAQIFMPDNSFWDICLYHIFFQPYRCKP